MSDDALIRMPQLGLTMTEGMIVEWAVVPGATVELGDLLYVVETEKIANEIFAERAGVIEQILVEREETVPVGTPLAVWVGGTVPDVQKIADVSPPSSIQTQTPDASPSVTEPTSMSRSRSAGGRVIASPRARKLARDCGISLEHLTGSGPGGRIIARDVVTAQETDRRPHPKPIYESTSSTPLKGARKVIAERMVRSQNEIPHFYLTATAEISELRWLHEGLKAKPELGKITLTHWIATAVGLALRDEPRFRTVHIDGGEVALDNTDVGIAISTGTGLMAPLVRNVGEFSLAENAARIEAIITKARNGDLNGEDLTGGATTISNLGGYRIEQVLPLINPGQSSIFGIGREQAVFRPDENQQPVLRTELGLSLACDHRIFNGVDGARFLQRVCELIEDPLIIIAQARR